MDKQTEEKLTQIRRTHISSLTSADKEFLRARRSYLGPRDQKKYADILNESPTLPNRITRRQARRAKEEAVRLQHPAAL